MHNVVIAVLMLLHIVNNTVITTNRQSSQIPRGQIPRDRLATDPASRLCLGRGFVYRCARETFEVYDTTLLNGIRALIFAHQVSLWPIMSVPPLFGPPSTAALPNDPWRTRMFTFSLSCFSFQCVSIFHLKNMKSIFLYGDQQTIYSRAYT